MGNPPFGHAGESAIQTWFASRQHVGSERDTGKSKAPVFNGLDTTREHSSQLTCDFLKWEGNAQTLRLLSKLQVLADEFGLNLTCATFSAACKYIAPSHELKEEHERSKPGFFASEEEVVKRVAAETGTVDIRNPITYLVEASDDIVYSTGDLEDGVRKGLLDWQFLEEELLGFSGNDALVVDVLKRAKDKVKFDPKERPVRNEEVAQAFRTFSIGAMKDSAFECFRQRREEIEAGMYHSELVKDSACKVASFVDACKKLGQKHVYPSTSTLKLELMGKRVIHDLMDIFWEGAEVCGGGTEPKECKKGFEGKAFSLISSNYKKVFSKALEEQKLPERYCRLQLVTDQIAGMTDTYAIILHKRLMNG